MMRAPTLQLRSFFVIALLFFATVTSACAQEKTKRMIPGPSVKELVPESPNEKEDGTSQISVTASSQSKPKDVFGWEEARWGMTADDIAKLFGSRAERVHSVKVYGDWFYLYTVPVNLQGERYTAILLMDYSTAKLARVDIRLDQYKSPVPREDVFNAVEAMLTQQYGQPDSKKDEPRSDNWRIRRTWKFPTSTVELWLYWQKDDDQGSNVGISYYPTAAVK